MDYYRVNCKLKNGDEETCNLKCLPEKGDYLDLKIKGYDFSKVEMPYFKVINRVFLINDPNFDVLLLLDKGW